MTKRKPVNLMHADLTVLHIDDSPAEREWVQLALRAAKIAWLGAPDPVRGARLAQAHRVDVVLLDLHIPPLYGIEAYETLRACGYSGPVVTYTGNPQLEIVDALHAEGVAVAVKGSTSPQGLIRLIEAASRE
jgi:DNA-binding NarL/FixJ family response regulator